VLAGLGSLLVACVLVFDTTVPLDGEGSDAAERVDAPSDDTDATPPDASPPLDSGTDVAAQDVELDTTPEPGDTNALQDADAEPGGDVAPDADAGPPPTDAAEVRDSDDGDAGEPLAVLVTAPESDDYLAGQMVLVTWEAAWAERLTLSLVTAAGCSADAEGVVIPALATLGAGTRTWEWTVPEALEPGEYRVRVLASGPGGDAVGCSAVFRVVLPAACETLGCDGLYRICRTGESGAVCDECVLGYRAVADLCEPVQCGAAPPAPPRSTLVSAGTQFGEVARYACDTGHSTNGTATGERAITRRCGASGDWEPASAGSCEPLNCGAPPLIDNGMRSFTTTTFGSLVSYTCFTGFLASGSTAVRCGTTGLWDTPPACRDINECDAGGVCAAVGNGCTNIAGSWECACTTGYTGATVVGGSATCAAVPAGSLGAPCSADSECPASSWCSTVAGQRRCAPRVFTGTAHVMEFVFVPAGTFVQGQADSFADEVPFTSILSRAYFVARTEVTQAQWTAATGGVNPSCFQSTTGLSCAGANANPNGPVERVDWYATLAYANWLSVNQGLTPCYALVPASCADTVADWADGTAACTDATFSGLACRGYRLPTESEWEYAARAGSTGSYFWGEAADTTTVGRYAWFNGNTGRAQAVATRTANPWGLYDTSGNVIEWVWDVHDLYPAGPVTDWLGPATGFGRVRRGGSWFLSASLVRSAFRVVIPRAPESYSNDYGFRLARSLP
jgi:formylglycine-generating enzyme required for sulfatase activity